MGIRDFLINVATNRLRFALELRKNLIRFFFNSSIVVHIYIFVKFNFKKDKLIAFLKVAFFTYIKWP